MSDSVRPHRRQPARLLRPWDSPGKNTGVGCHFLLQRMKVKSESEVTQSCPTLSDPVNCSLPGSLVHGIFQARPLEWGAIAFSAAHILPCPTSSSENSLICVCVCVCACDLFWGRFSSPDPKLYVVWVQWCMLMPVFSLSIHRLMFEISLSERTSSTKDLICVK